MTRRFAALAVSVLVAGIAACSGTSDPALTRGESTSGSETTTEHTTAEQTTPEPTAKESTAEPTTSEATGTAAEALDFLPPGEVVQSDEWLTLGGGDLFLESVNVVDGDQDQVVALFSGQGPLGFEAKYVDTAIEQGRGEPIVPDGANAIFQVSLEGLRYPELTEEVVMEASGDDINVLVDPPFEGMSLLVIGLDEPVPFHVEVGTNPITLTITFSG